MTDDRIRKVDRYITTDGREHLDPIKAREHQAEVDFAKLYNGGAGVSCKNGPRISDKGLLHSDALCRWVRTMKDDMWDALVKVRAER